MILIYGFLFTFSVNPVISEPYFGKNTDQDSSQSKSASISDSQKNDSRLDKFFLKKMKKAGIVGMQVAYVSNKELAWQGNYGLKEYGSNMQVDSNTLFMIASCSKPVTALGILKLMDQGKIDLDDPVNQYLPFGLSNPKFPDRQTTAPTASNWGLAPRHWRPWRCCAMADRPTIRWSPRACHTWRPRYSRTGASTRRSTRASRGPRET